MNNRKGQISMIFLIMLLVIIMVFAVFVGSTEKIVKFPDAFDINKNNPYPSIINSLNIGNIKGITDNGLLPEDKNFGVHYDES